MLTEYFEELQQALKRGDATEHTHRPALKSLLEKSDQNITATNEPARVSGNAPDFVITRGKVILGHVETKDVNENLNDLLKSEQLIRYRQALPNLILCDYLEFIWLVNGDEKVRIRIASWDGNKLAQEPDAEQKWIQFINGFIHLQALTVKTPKQLASNLAAQTRLLKNVVMDLLEGKDEELTNHKKTFTQVLLPELTDEQFADMFAQTIAYGLFTARCFDPTPKDFSRTEANQLIPRTNPFLRRFFNYIAGPDLNVGFVWLVDQIVDLLAHADMEAILHHYGRKRGFEDPIFHFYETFLSAYDAQLRESRGVYYTPEPVVDFIVRGVDYLLREQFNCSQGLADEDTIILDPATGTATFLQRVIQLIYAYQVERGQKGQWSAYVRAHLLPRVFGFELMMAPYTVAHLKLALQLADTGFEFRTHERINIFLTNTLDQIKHQTGALLAQWLSEEAEHAEEVKNKLPVQVVLGNPPYSGHSANQSQWLDELLELYKREPDGGKLQERNPKYLNDDYVKFMRFAHWRVATTGYGIVAYIANHSWLDNPTFRGMRAALLRDFDRIYVMDLHGNTKKKEKAPDGGEDKNVFDIQQGVAILFLIRLPEHKNSEAAKVFHADLWGDRAGKYDALASFEFSRVEWKPIEPHLPLLIFKPVNQKLKEEYYAGWSITGIFPVNSTGIKTHRDHLVFDFTKDELIEKINDFIDPEQTDDVIRARYFGTAGGKYPAGDNRDWQMAEARQELRKDDHWHETVHPCLYRPFDIRWLLNHKSAIDFGRWEVMDHMQKGNNFGISTTRNVEVGTYEHVMVTDQLITHHSVSLKETNYLFPLYVQDVDVKDEKNKTRDVFSSGKTWQPDNKGRVPNLNPEFVSDVQQKLKMQFVSSGEGDGQLTFGPEDIMHYIYSILHAASYRERYEDYLKSDFPRIPLTSNPVLFKDLIGLGEQLVDLHLMHSPALSKFITTYPVDGEHRVEKISYKEPDATRNGRVYINKTQYFEGINPEDWEFLVGGYQVLDKWLKDRKDRVLSLEDIEHYQKIVVAILETRKLMDEIDNAIPAWPLT